MKTYICRPGDSISSLSRKLNTSPEALRAANCLSHPEKLIPGLALIVPSDSPVQGSLELCCEFFPSLSPDTAAEAAEYLSFCCTGRCCIKSDDGIGEPWGNPLFTKLCADRGALPLLTVSNLIPDGSFSGRLANAALNDAAGRKNLSAAVINAALNGGYMGIYLELCYLFPFDRDNYLCFLEYLSASAHEKGLFLLVGFECGSELSGNGSFPYFCSRLYELSDKIVLLALDYCYKLNFPSPASPLYMVRQELQKLNGVMPPEKLILAVSDKALDFRLPYSHGRRAEAMSSARALNLAVSAADTISYDERSAACSFNYRHMSGQSHRVFCTDIRSMAAKLSFAESCGFCGLFFRQSERIFGPEFNFVCMSRNCKKYI